MKKLLILIALTLLNFSNAFAVTLYEALNQTYQNNIQLNAERENIKASEEDINISKADYKPSLTLSGSKSIENGVPDGARDLRFWSQGDPGPPFWASWGPMWPHRGPMWSCLSLSIYIYYILYTRTLRATPPPCLTKTKTTPLSSLLSPLSSPENYTFVTSQAPF